MRSPCCVWVSAVVCGQPPGAWTQGSAGAGRADAVVVVCGGWWSEPRLPGVHWVKPAGCNAPRRGGIIGKWPDGLGFGDLRWFVVGVVCFSADVCGGVPALWVCGAVSCLAFVVACRFLLGVCGGMPFLAWRVWWRAVSRLACVVASHAVLLLSLSWLLWWRAMPC